MTSGKFIKNIKHTLTHIPYRAYLLIVARRLAMAMLSAIVPAVVGVALVYGGLKPLPLLAVFGVLTAVILLFFLLLHLTSSLPGAVSAFSNTLLALFFVSAVLALVIHAIAVSDFSLSDMDWVVIFTSFYRKGSFYATLLTVTLALAGIHFGFLHREELIELFRAGGVLRGKGALSQIEANMENSRWLTDAERDRLFSTHSFSDLATCKKDGVPIRAVYDGRGDISVTFHPACHSLIIGSTGSGKTTTFINPMIQLLGNSGAGSSMIITDPKGELLALHSRLLTERGYDVKVLDLRDAYHSYRWNPLEPLWDAYQAYLSAEHEAFERNDNVIASGLQLVGEPKDFGDTWFEFHGKAYADMERMVAEVKIFRAKIFDEMYEDMSDLVSVLVPVQNQNDPMWEKGARSITMAVLLAMLEDSANPALGMTREKFNLFNLSKILQNSDDDYLALRNYFQGRDKLSKAVANARQVLDAPDKTRSSYMSVLLEKLAIFNDTGICALTSTSDFQTADLAKRPTALFVKIPDEKDTRHGLAAIFLTNVYKSLIKIASSYEDLSLPRNVYYILDEFGNMPKIEKFDKMITVGRSRKIWFNMVVQSYTQLNNVYGDTVADIVKGNCGIKMFIGSNDMGTCKEYSELCGNITVVTQGTSRSGGKNADTNTSQSIQTRPLIYPSELQRLNNKFSTGNSIVVTFGNYPLKTKFTPSYKTPLYKTGMMSLDELEGRLFEEEAVFYDIERRNEAILTPQKS